MSICQDRAEQCPFKLGLKRDGNNILSIAQATRIVFYPILRYAIHMQYLIDGKQIASTVLTKVEAQTAVLKRHNIIPKLVVVLVGNDQPSHTYVRRKQLAAEKCGIAFHLELLPENISQVALIDRVRSIQQDPTLSGLIVQLPLPEHLYTPTVLNSIEPQFDVDCLTNTNLGRLMMKDAPWQPPTPAACMEVITSLGMDVAGKNVVLIGVGALVGKPLAIMLMNARASITTVNRSTKDVVKKCLEADFIITGVGKANTVTGEMVAPGAVVIDAGVCFVNNTMRGDANVDEIVSHAYITPTPGGVGPITVAKLLANTVTAAAKQHNITIPEL